MEFNFEYYDWMRLVNEEPGIIAFASSFGVIGALLVIGLLRWLLKIIGLRRLAGWKMLDNFMISLAVTGFLGFLSTMFLLVIIKQSSDDSGGIRLVLIWLVLFIFVFYFCTTKRSLVFKWYDDKINGKFRSNKKSRNKVDDDTDDTSEYSEAIPKRGKSEVKTKKKKR